MFCFHFILWSLSFIFISNNTAKAFIPARSTHLIRPVGQLFYVPSIIKHKIIHPPAREVIHHYMMVGPEDFKDDILHEGIIIPESINWGYIWTLISSEAILYFIGLTLGLLFGVDVFRVKDLVTSSNDLVVIASFSSGMVLAGLIFDIIPLKEFQLIARETKLFVLQLFGRGKGETDIWQVLGTAALLAFAAALCEEVFFRGFIFSGIESLFGELPALLLSSAVFGLAHFPVFGANSFVEAVLGGVFGYTYMISGHDLFVPIAVHFLYDLFTLFVTWIKARNELREVVERRQIELEPGSQLQSKQGYQYQNNYNISTTEGLVKLKAAAKEAFDLIDADRDGFIDKVELALCMRVFRYVKRSELKKTVEELFIATDTNKDGKIDFDEFLHAAQSSMQRRGSGVFGFGSPVLYI
eukprot:gene7226-14737_t